MRENSLVKRSSDSQSDEDSGLSELCELAFELFSFSMIFTKRAAQRVVFFWTLENSPAVRTSERIGLTLPDDNLAVDFEKQVHDAVRALCEVTFGLPPVLRS